MSLQKILSLCEEMKCYAQPKWQERCNVLMEAIKNEIIRESLRKCSEGVENEDVLHEMQCECQECLDKWILVHLYYVMKKSVQDINRS